MTFKFRTRLAQWAIADDLFDSPPTGYPEGNIRTLNLTILLVTKVKLAAKNLTKKRPLTHVHSVLASYDS